VSRQVEIVKQVDKIFVIEHGAIVENFVQSLANRLPSTGIWKFSFPRRAKVWGLASQNQLNSIGVLEVPRKISKQKTY
jgi:hypothetical protein